MRWLLFLSKVAFICNLAFLISFIFRVTDWMNDYEVTALIIIAGWLLSVVFNPAVNLIYLFVFWINRKNLTIVPAWMIVMNLLFLILQLIFLLLMNIDKY